MVFVCCCQAPQCFLQVAARLGTSGGKGDQNINDQFNWKIYNEGNTECLAPVSELIRNKCIWWRVAYKVFVTYGL